MRTFYIFLTTLCFLNISLFSQMDNSGMPSNTTYTKPIIVEKNNWQISTSNIINVIPAPMAYIADIAYDGQHILAEGYNEYLIYKINPTNGDVISTVPTDIKRPYGLAFNGLNILILDNSNKVVKEIDADDGTIYNVYPINFLQQSYPTGLAWTGNDYWFNDAISPSATVLGDKTLNIDNTGTLVNEFDATGDYPSGMAYDGTYIWTVDNVNLLIHQIDPISYNVIKTIEAPGGIFPNGLAWDGQYLWVANNDSDSIYQVDVGTATNITANEDNNAVVGIYPNPAIDKIKIEFNTQDKINNIQIFSAKGQLVQVLNANNQTWDCTNNFGNKVKSGVYFICLYGESSVYKEKVIVL